MASRAESAAMATKKKTSGAASEPRFGEATFAYLRDLGENNRKEWFEANRERYEAHVREPALALIREMGPRLKKAGVPLVADDRKVGGSLMRVHKDVRFSKDKSPYKTNVGIHFRHAAGKDVHAPGFYFHIGLDECFVGLGMWHPEPAALEAIRKRILDKPKVYQKLIEDPALTKVWRSGGESLKRPPRGYPADHPLIAELMRKDHILVADLRKKDVISPTLPDLLSSHLAAGKGHLRFLCEAVDV